MTLAVYGNIGKDRILGTLEHLRKVFLLLGEIHLLHLLRYLPRNSSSSLLTLLLYVLSLWFAGSSSILPVLDLRLLVGCHLAAQVFNLLMH